MLTPKEIDSLSNFVKAHLDEYQSNFRDNINIIKGYLTLHNSYNTLVTLKDNDKFIAITRFNIENDTAEVLDAIIDKDFRGKGLMREIAKIGHERFPYVKFIKFEGPFDAIMKTMPIEKYIGEKDEVNI